MSVAAGSLDDSGGLKIIGHVFVAEAGNYYKIADGLPRYQKSNAGDLENDGGG
jgi:hypothetical protein